MAHGVHLSERVSEQVEYSVSELPREGWEGSTSQFTSTTSQF